MVVKADRYGEIIDVEIPDPTDLNIDMEPDRLTALELAVAELGAVMMGGMTSG